jgi:hypothetical protein
MDFNALQTEINTNYIYILRTHCAVNILTHYVSYRCITEYFQQMHTEPTNAQVQNVLSRIINYHQAAPITVHKSIYDKSNIDQFTNFLIHTGKDKKKG